MAEKGKGEQAPREAAADEARRRKGQGASQSEDDPREEEGYSQPESSAQKTPPKP